MASRRKSKHLKESKYMETSKILFGQPLVAEGMEEKCCIFVEYCLRFLEDKGIDQQGLFRLCGCKTQIDQLKELADSDVYSFQIPESQEPHSVAGLLKQYFREMPVPLIPFSLTNKFISAICVPQDKKEEEIQKAITLLPSTNRYILGKLCAFMHKVQLNKDKNLMSSENLSTCMGPNLLRSESNDPRLIIANTPHVKALFTFLFGNADLLFSNVEQFRPQVTKVKSLSHINKLMFIIYLPPLEKKSVIINPSEKLGSVLQKICQTRGTNIKSYVAIDGSGNTVEMDRQLADIEGKCITLVSKEIKQTVTEPELPSTQHFLLPVQNNTLSTTSAAGPPPSSSSSSSSSARNRKTQHLPPRKAFSSTLLPRVKPGERLPNTTFDSLNPSRGNSKTPPFRSNRPSSQIISNSNIFGKATTGKTPSKPIDTNLDTEIVASASSPIAERDLSTARTFSAPNSTSSTPRVNRKTLANVAWEEGEMPWEHTRQETKAKSGPPPPVYVPAPPKVDENQQPPTSANLTSNSSQKEKPSRRSSKKRRESKEKPLTASSSTIATTSSSSCKKKREEHKKSKSNTVLHISTRDNIY